MKATQYTIRNIPEPVDRYLRKRARLSGRSLNQVVIDELSEKAGIDSKSITERLDWFIGQSSIEDVSLTELDKEDEVQKKLTKDQWHNDDN